MVLSVGEAERERVQIWEIFLVVALILHVLFSGILGSAKESGHKPDGFVFIYLISRLGLDRMVGEQKVDTLE